jgi:hypothetical protein
MNIRSDDMESLELSIEELSKDGLVSCTVIGVNIMRFLSNYA